MILYDFLLEFIRLILRLNCGSNSVEFHCNCEQNNIMLKLKAEQIRHNSL